MDCGEHNFSSEGFQVDIAFLEGVLQKNGYNPEALIMILQDITANYNFLPKEALTYISQRLNINLSQIYGIATFYKAFSLTPRGKYIINVCLGTACHVRGGRKIIDKLSNDLGIQVGETTKDKRFTLELVRCVGCCSLGPVVVVDGNVFGRLTQEKVPRLLKEFK